MQTVTTLKLMSVLSGRSISTVSKALNDKYDVSKATRIKIQELARDHNYIPNNVAVALRKKKNNTIAVIVPQLTKGLLVDLVSQIQKASYDRGYKLLVLQSSKSSKKEGECINFINDGSVDGAIIVRSKHIENNYIISIPIVFIQLKNLEFSKSNFNELIQEYFNRLIINIT
jgi:DNA-binding LacI/PurR family transcriptional regulator